MRQVAVTGLGVLCPLGDNLETVWAAMMAGQTGVGPVQAFDPSLYRVKIGGELRARRRVETFQKENPGRYELASIFSILASQEALRQANLSPDVLSSLRVGSFFGTTMGEVQLAERMSELNARKNSGQIERNSFQKVQASRIAFSVLDFLGLGGETMVFSNACASGNYAIGWGFDKIRQGRLDAALCGGVDVFSRVAFTGFNRLLSLTPDKCRPFSANRKGLVVSEGVGVLLLEDLEKARARGAKVYSEITGYGLGMDAYHMTSPHPEGEGAYDSIQRAMREARVDPSQVDFISAHGTGTPANDKTESIAIKKVFGSNCAIPVNSIKSMIGHTMGAASAIEAVMTCLSLDRGFLLPTINWETEDPGCISDCIPNESRSFKGKVALSNSFAFGGNTSCLVVAKNEAIL